MRLIEIVQVAVDVVDPTLRVVRVAGRLTLEGARRIVTLLDGQCRLVESGGRHTTDVVVDLEGVSWFDPGALELLRFAGDNCRTAGISLHVSGCGARLPLLPFRVRQALAQFSSYPTADLAVTSLVRTD